MLSTSPMPPCSRHMWSYTAASSATWPQAQHQCVLHLHIHDCAHHVQHYAASKSQLHGCKLQAVQLGRSMISRRVQLLQLVGRRRMHSQAQACMHAGSML